MALVADVSLCLAPQHLLSTQEAPVNVKEQRTVSSSVSGLRKLMVTTASADIGHPPHHGPIEWAQRLNKKGEIENLAKPLTKIRFGGEYSYFKSHHL